jgi:hypothetical protein
MPILGTNGTTNFLNIILEHHRGFVGKQFLP